MKKICCFLFILAVIFPVSCALFNPVFSPQISISSPANEETVTGTSLKVSGSVSKGVEQVYIAVNGGGFTEMPRSAFSESTNWTYTLDNLSNSSYTIRVYGVNNFGQQTEVLTNRFSVMIQTKNLKNALYEWTVMVYLDADNDLERAGIADFNEMEAGVYQALSFDSSFTNRFKILVMLDRASYSAAYSSYYGSGDNISPTAPGETNWEDTRLYLIQSDPFLTNVYFKSDRLDDGSDEIHHIDPLGEKNMGSPDTLTGFVNFGMTNYPASNYSLIFWNHGIGPKNSADDERKRGICVDMTDFGDQLYLDEVQEALNKSALISNHLDIIGFDACMMATVETAYEFRNIATYMVASMHSEQEDGWDYERLFRYIPQTVISELSPQVFSEIMVKSYRDYIESNYNRYVAESGETMSAVKLLNIEQLKTALDEFAVSLYPDDEPAMNRKVFEGIRDDAVNYYASDSEALSFPFYDIYSLCRLIVDGADDNSKLFGDSTDSIVKKAENVLNALSSIVLYSYGDKGNGHDYYDGYGSVTGKGLSIVIPQGDMTYRWAPYYPDYQYWYTSADTIEIFGIAYPYGGIDFCEFNSNGSVEYWLELFEAWYDPYGDYDNAGF